MGFSGGCHEREREREKERGKGREREKEREGEKERLCKHRVGCIPRISTTITPIKGPRACILTKNISGRERGRGRIESRFLGDENANFNSAPPFITLVISTSFKTQNDPDPLLV